MTHKAGRELDALVAEKVMGWIWIDHPTENIRYFRPGKQFRYGAIVSKDDSHEIDYTNQLPNYSTDIAAAWTVGEHMRSCGWVFETSEHINNPVTRCAMFAMGNYDPYEKGWDIEHMKAASTMPLAICLAALRAVGIDA